MVQVGTTADKENWVKLTKACSTKIETPAGDKYIADKFNL